LRHYVVCTPIQHRNHPPLKGDAFFRALHRVFGLLQAAL